MSTLISLRKKIQKIDSQIIKKLAERQQLVREVGSLKNNVGKKVIDVAREQELMQYYENLCNQYGLQVSFIKRLFKMIIVYSRRLQR